MRLFIAVNFPPNLIEAMEKIRDPLVSSFPNVAWTKRENLHFTLKFLGNIKEKEKEDLLPKIKTAIRESTLNIQPFSFTFTRFGYFEKEQLIIWLGISSQKQLLTLVQHLEDRLAYLGFPKEKRNYSPHLTIGRGKHLSLDLKTKIKDILRVKIPSKVTPLLVREISLMESVLKKTGPIYTLLENFSLSET